MKSQFKLFLFLIPIFTIIGCSSSSDENEPQLATLQTVAISNITPVSATSGGTITSNGNSEITEKGVCWNTSPNPTITNSHTSDGTGSSAFISDLNTLLGNTTYYVRAYATNSVGTAYGNEVSFTTNAIVAPTVTTTAASNVKQVTADSGGNVTSDGGSAVTIRGVCWNTTGNPTTSDPKTLAGTGSGIFVATAINITPNTTYYLRAFATNAAGTGYGTQITFTTQNLSLPGGGVTDIDGNTYTTVILGGKEWMVENLRTTKYRNGDLIVNSTTGAQWQANASSGTGTWGYYNNTSGYNLTYGKLYNWYAAVDPRNIAPVGWHVPSKGELDNLRDYLGGSTIAGGKLKKTGTAEWNSPNTGATNESGFTALPGGHLNSINGVFENFGTRAYFWSTTPNGTIDASDAMLFNNNTQQNNAGYSDKGHGDSIRCVKD